jgi:hypothetical protein
LRDAGCAISTSAVAVETDVGWNKVLPYPAKTAGVLNRNRARASRTPHLASRNSFDRISFDRIRVDG